MYFMHFILEKYANSRYKLFLVRVSKQPYPLISQYKVPSCQLSPLQVDGDAGALCPDNVNNLEQLKCRWRRICQISAREKAEKDRSRSPPVQDPFPQPFPCTHADCNRFTCALLTIVKWHWGKCDDDDGGWSVRGTSLTPHVAGDRCVGLQIVPGEVGRREYT